MKKQTSLAEKQYQGLNEVLKSDEKKEPVTIKNAVVNSISKLMHGSNFRFIYYSNVRKYYDFSFMTKYDKLISFYHRLNELRNLVPWTKKPKKLKE